MTREKLKILILEDVKSDADLIMLQFEYMDFDPVFKVTCKKDEYLNLLETLNPNLILSDFNVPSFDGMQALKILRERDPITPFIFVTGTLGEENAVEAIKTGATDFIAKDRVEHLPAAIIKAFREKKEKVIRMKEEAKFRALIENSSESTIIVNEDTSVKYVSPSIKKILGYNQEEFLEASIFTHFPQEEISERMKVLKKVLKSSNKEAITDECKIRTKAGEYIWVSAILSDQRKTDGIEGVVINFRDIDDRKKIEREIQTNEMRFKALTHEGTDLLSVINVNGEYTFVSGNHKRIIGYDSKHLIGKRPVDFVHPEDAFLVMQHLEKLKKKKRTKPSPFRFKDAKGKYHWVESIFTNMSDDNLIAGVVINSRDVSEMVEKTNELELSNERYYYASKAAEDHIYEWHLETDEITRIGDSMRMLFGYTNQEAESGDFWVEKVHPDDREEAHQKLLSHIEDVTATKCEHEYRFLKANGAYAYVNDTGYILRNDKGKAMRLIGAVSDITKKKNMELHSQLMAAITSILSKKGKLFERMSAISKILLEFAKAYIAEFWMTSIDNSELIRHGFATRDRNGKIFIEHTKNYRFSTCKIDSLPVESWKKGEPVLLNIDDSSLFARAKEAREVGIKTGLAIPIQFDEDIIGTFLLLAKEGAELDRHLPIIESVAKEMAPYIQRKKTEEELDRFFNLSPDVLCIAGMDGFYKKVNPAMCNMLGLSKDEILTKPIVDFVHPDDIEATTKEIGSLVEGEPTWRFENRYRMKNGQYTWLSWKAISVFEEGLIYAVARNITEQKELEDLLEKSQRLAKIGSWYFDPKTKLIEWTSIARDIYGVDSAYEPTIESMSGFFPKEDFELLVKRFSNSVTDGKPWTEEMEVITKEGMRKWVRIAGNSEFVDGECVRVYGSIQDIHELKSAEMEKISILESITDGFVAVDHEGIIRLWNPMAEQLFFIEKSKVLGLDIGSVFSFGANKKLLNELSLAMNARDTRQFEYFNDQNRWLDVSIFPKRDGFTLYLRDVTEKRQIEKNLIHAITETQEKERARFGRELHDGITQYLAVSKMNLSQFKNLLEAGNTNMNVLDKVLDYLQQTIDESRTISHGLLSTTLQNNGLFNALEEIFENVRSNKGIEMELDCELPEGTGLSKEIELNVYRIIQELTNNMVKYAGASKATLSCLLNNNRLELEMKDDGKGIPDLEKDNFKKGAGLNNMAVRVKSMNGSFEMQNLHPGLSTKIVIPVGS